ncbi:unnamed protein product [Trichobilharzia szidati]|nr:unnamed protein product [Trichobilharzia szidati]
MPKRVKPEISASEEIECKRRNTLFRLIGSDISVLISFIESVSDENVDEIVTDAILTGDVMGILKYLDTGQDRKHTEVIAVLKSLYIIILRSSRELAASFPTLARDLAEGFLEDSRLSLCLNLMWKSQSAELLKVSLQLLATVVTVSEDLARGLLRSIDFESKTMTKCSKRRNLLDKCDVRTCFINFLASFVYLNSNVVLRELVDKKGALHLLVSESFVDKYSNVMLILCVLQKVAENRSVSKTQRARIFNRYCLQRLVSLYFWRGEGKSVNEVLKKGDVDVNENEVSSVRCAVHKLLLHLFTSSRLGVVFSTKFDSEIQYNGLILQCLTCAQMDGAYMDPLRTELVVKALCKCPDVFVPYLDHLAPTLYPRDSSGWFGVMDFVLQLYQSVGKYILQFIVNALSYSLTVDVMANAITNFCVLSPKMVDPISQAVKYNESSRVKIKAVELMTCLRQQLKIPLTWLTLNQLPSGTGFTSDQLKAKIEMFMRERLPGTKWLNRFKKVFDETLNDQSILADQILTSSNQDEPEEVVEEEPVKVEDMVESVNQSLKDLPKKVRKAFKLFEKFCIPNDCDNNIPEDLLDTLSELPELTKVCFENYSTYPVVYQYLSKAIHLMYNNPSLSSLHKPKVFLSLLKNHVNLNSILSSSKLPKVADDSKYATSNLSTTQDNLLKENLFKFLLEIAHVTPKLVFKSIPVLWILAAYSGTMSSLDRTILKLFYVLEKYSPGSLLQCKYIIWGPNVYKHCQFDVQGNNLIEPTLLLEPNVNTLFTMLDDHQLLDSAFNFPMYRKWFAGPNSYSSDFETIEINSTLDPCFILHVLDSYLRQYQCQLHGDNDAMKSIQFLKTFYIKNCLSYAIAGLSSYSKHIRNMAKSIIAVYRKLINAYIASSSTPSTTAATTPPASTTKTNTISSSNHQPSKLLSAKHFPEGQQIAFLLDTLRNSLSHGGGSVFGGGSRKAKLFHTPMDSGGRLTKLHANFFIKALNLFSRPENPMFQPIWNCLLAKAAVDLRHVPEFLRLFFSTNNKFNLERQWICGVCVSGLGDPADYLVMESSLVFKHVLTAYSLPSADNNFKLLVLRLLVNATKHTRIVHALIRFHALPLWLSRHAALNSSAEQKRLFLCILENIHNALVTKSSNQPVLEVLNLIGEEYFAKNDLKDVKAITIIPSES